MYNSTIICTENETRFENKNVRIVLGKFSCGAGEM